MELPAMRESLLFGHRWVGSLYVSKFMAIRRAMLELTPLTLIVGDVGSGKSSLLDALVLASSVPGMRDLLNRNVAWHLLIHRLAADPCWLVHKDDYAGAVRFWSRRGYRSIELSAFCPEKKYGWKEEILRRRIKEIYERVINMLYDSGVLEACLEPLIRSSVFDEVAARVSVEDVVDKLKGSRGGTRGIVETRIRTILGRISETSVVAEITFKRHLKPRASSRGLLLFPPAGRNLSRLLERAKEGFVRHMLHWYRQATCGYHCDSSRFVVPLRDAVKQVAECVAAEIETAILKALYAEYDIPTYRPEPVLYISSSLYSLGSSEYVAAVLGAFRDQGLLSGFIDKLIEAAVMADLDIDDIMFENGSLFLCVDGRRVPLSLLGDGTARMVMLLAGLVAAQYGVLLVIDEPCAFLGSELAEKFANVVIGSIPEIAGAGGAVVMSTKNLSLVETLAVKSQTLYDERLASAIYMHKGRVVDVSSGSGMVEHARRVLDEA